MLLNLAMLAYKGGYYHYSAHVAVALALIALGVGFMVCAKANQVEGCKKWGKFVGYLITIISLMLLICLTILIITGFGKARPYPPRPTMGAPLPPGHPPIEAPAP